MRTARALIAVLLALMLTPVARAADAEKDWYAHYQEGLRRSKGGLAAGGGGLAVGAMGAAVVLIAGGCGQEGEVCEGPWLPDGLAITGVVVGGFGAGGLAAAGMRARRGLRNMDVMVTPSPGIMAWAFVAATAAGFATWIDLRRPTDYLPKMPAIRDTGLMGLTVGLGLASYGFGIWQYALVKRAGRDLKPDAEDTEDAEMQGASLLVTPWATRDAHGIALLGRF